MSENIQVMGHVSMVKNVGLERMGGPSFFRKYCGWRDGDVSPTKFKFISLKEVLPFNSVVHLLGNFRNIEEGKQISDTPDINHFFIRNENIRKIIYHQKAPLTSGEITTPNDYIFRTMQLDRNLEKFKSTNRGMFIPKMNLEDLSIRDNSLCIINHNPIFRLFVRGTMRNWRTTEHLLASIFNTVKYVPDKVHYFVIPLTTKIYPKGRFTQVSQRVAASSISDKDSYQYCLFAQLYNYLNVNAKVKSVFDYLSDASIGKIVLMFECGGNYICWPLANLKQLNERNRIYPRIFNHFNGFILKGLEAINGRASSIHQESADTEFFSDEVDEKQIVKAYSDLSKIPIEKIYPQQEQKEVAQETPVQDNPEDIKEIERVISGLNKVDFGLAKKISEPDITDVNAIITSDGNATSSDVVESDEVSEPESTPTQETPVSEKQRLYDRDGITYYTSEKEHDDIRLPNSFIEAYTKPEQVAHVGKEYLQALNKQTEINIAMDNTLTSAQKERALRMSKSAYSVTIDGETIEDIILSPVSPVIPENKVADIPEEVVPDRSMLNSTVFRMDKAYMDSLFKRHLAGMAISMTPQGLYLDSVKKETQNNMLSQTDTYTFKYKSLNGKIHNLTFTFPTIRDDGTFLVNGVKAAMSKQLATKPIAKISPTRVSLASYYNKTIVEKVLLQAKDYLRFMSSYIEDIQEQAPEVIKNIQYEIRELPEESAVSSEYWRLAGKYHSFTIHHKQSGAVSYLYFGNESLEERAKHFVGACAITPEVWKKIVKIEKEKQWTFVGLRKGNDSRSPSCYYMDLGSRLHLYGEQHGKDVHETSSLTDLLWMASDIRPAKLYSEWTDIKILDDKFPVGFLLCYRYGLFGLMRKLGVKPDIVDTKTLKQRNLPASTFVLPFADRKNLVIPRYPMKISLLLQGLSKYDTKSVALEDFDTKDVYYNFLTKTSKANYLIGIDDTFDMFIDIITYERLKQMGEPTDFGSLLVRATEMLVTPYHKLAAGMENHCIKSYERLNGILYNEMAAQMRQYRKKKNPNAVFSINPNSVMQRIMQDPTVMPTEDINPIHDIKMTSKLSYLGMGGRQADSFTAEDRRYPSDGIGIISESTPSAAGVGIITQSSMNPNVLNNYGLMKTIDAKKDGVEPTSMLSVTALLMPGVTQDDAKRIVMAANFASHTVPTKEGETSRLRTGYEYMIAHRCGEIYAYPAKENGRVIDVDEKRKVAKIQYLDGTTEIIDYNTQYGQCSDMLVEQQQVITFKKGDKFKKGDVLRYNPQYFEPDPDVDRQVTYKHGITGKVALVENSTTFEDSNAITRKMSERLGIAPVEARMITLPATAVVHKYAKLGDIVDLTTPLLVFEQEDAEDLSGVGVDAKALEYLENLNRTAPKAKVNGQIVDITVMHACELSEMSRSIRKMVTEYMTDKNAIGQYAEDAANNYQYPKTGKVPAGSKYKGVYITEDTVVIRYYIREYFDQSNGDKIVLDSSLKTITCLVMDNPPVTESGQEIDATFSVLSISKRIVNSPIITGISENILATLEKKVLSEYFGDGGK